MILTATHPAAKYRFGQKVFWLTDKNQRYGTAHRCSFCNGLHYSEHYSEVVVFGVVEEMTWEEHYALGGQQAEATWRYNIKTDSSISNDVSNGIQGIREIEVFATHEEAEAVRVAEMEAAKKGSTR